MAFTEFKNSQGFSSYNKITSWTPPLGIGYGDFGTFYNGSILPSSSTAIMLPEWGIHPPPFGRDILGGIFGPRWGPGYGEFGFTTI